MKTINRTTQLHQPLTLDYFEHRSITEEMGGACDDRVKTIKTIFIAEKFNFFGNKCFQANDSEGAILHELQYGYLSSKPHVEGQLFPLIRPWFQVNPAIECKYQIPVEQSTSFEERTMLLTSND